MNLTYEANVGLIHYVSKKVFARSSAMRVGVEYDDIFQEMSIVFLKAVKKFDESKGFLFSTYYLTAAYSFANKLINREKRYSMDTKALSLDESRLNIADQSASQEVVVETMEALESAFTNLSSEAKMVIGFMAENAELLLRETTATLAKAEIGVEIGERERGATRQSQLRVATRLVCRAMKLSGAKEKSVWAEVSPLSEHLGY